MTKTDDIELYGVNVNNLKNIDIKIPKNKIVVFTGISGSGKSSLLFDTIAQESKRQMNMNYPMYLRRRMVMIERPEADIMNNLTFSIVVNQKSLGTNSRSNLGTALDISPMIRLLFSRAGNPSAGGAINYLRNDPIGACSTCKGAGTIIDLDESSLFNPKGSLTTDGINFKPIASSWQKKIYTNSGLFDINKPLKDYTAEEWKNLKYGPDQELKVEFNSSNTGQVFTETYEGIVPRFRRLYLNRDTSKLSKKVQEEIKEKIIGRPCRNCQGTGYSKEVLNSKINGLNIVDYYEMEMPDLSDQLKKIDHPLGKGLAQQILRMVDSLISAGLDYLNLSRPIQSLSGGERQRVKLVQNLGSSLNNVCYILDEPTSGLHAHDIDRIKDLLIRLKEDHNSVLVVEHNPEIMKIADQIIDLGPYAGEGGGKVIFQGSYQDILKEKSLTAKALKTPLKIKKNEGEYEDFYEIKGANKNNLKDISASFPKGALSLVTGLAGAGKSSLMEVFMEKYPDSIFIDQEGVGISSRSTPASYVNCLDDIRKLMAKKTNQDPGLFSFNSKGACPVCQGKGAIKPDVAFADPITVVCEACQGTRFSDQARSYYYRDKNIVDILNMTVDQALDFFSDQKNIREKLDLLKQVGLNYLVLGQTTSTMSGGELQRLKLALELQKEGKIYIMDEPTRGLSYYDIDKLLNVINRMVTRGNSLIIVDHNLKLISQADWIIDLGPGAGKKGGQVIFQGKLKDLLSCKDSITGRYLKRAVEERS